MSDLKIQLEKDLDVATWDMLEPHLKRGALVKVHDGLDLVEVGMAVAQDRAEVVKEWMDKGFIKNIEKKDEDLPEETKFKFLILSPYVLVQILKEKN